MIQEVTAFRPRTAWTIAFLLAFMMLVMLVTIGRG